MKLNLPDMYYIRSTVKENLLMLETVHNSTGHVLHKYEQVLKNKDEAAFLIEAYRQYMLAEERAIILMIKELADLFSIDYRKTNFEELMQLITQKAKEQFNVGLGR
ncbi:hypothetical protein [Lysinibacillus xylanilyticus]|uniref:hypothetical protein n=1 Tax=Lysinibacillus xylanilyticus TaxID=582475 RepID=UPI003CFC79FE